MRSFFAPILTQTSFGRRCAQAYAAVLPIPYRFCSWVMVIHVCVVVASASVVLVGVFVLVIYASFRFRLAGSYLLLLVSVYRRMLFCNRYYLQDILGEQYALFT